MGIQDLNKIYLKRSGLKFFDSAKAEGIRGTLRVGAVTFETIERGNNYVQLPVGEFLLTSTKDKQRGKVLIVQPDGRYGHNVPTLRGGIAGIMIHQAELPSHLEGCLAPGKSFDITTNKLQKSSEALEDIFTYFGGFGETKLAGWIVVE